MKEPKRTPVPVPESKVKSKARSEPAKVPLSQEFVGSDDETSTAETEPLKAAEQPSKSIGIYKPNQVAKKASKQPAKKHAEPQAASKSAPLPKKVKAKESAPKKSEKPARGGDGDGSSDSSSDSSSDNSNNKPAPSRPLQPSQPLQSPQPSQTQKRAHAVAFQAAQAYEPPRGFHAVPVNEKTMSGTGDMFDKLKGKQIWHITAPADISLKNLRDLAMDKALNGEAIMACEGVDYGVSNSHKAGDAVRELLIPRQDGYMAVSAGISQTLHVQAIAQIPALSPYQADQHTASEAAVSITRSTIRAPRAQRKGLKMRFLPTGFDGNAVGTLGGSDSESEAPQETARPGISNEVALSPKKTKKNRTPEEAKVREAKKAKKEKKEKKEKKRALEAAKMKP